MPSLERDLRKKLEKAVVQARTIAETGALKALRELAVQERESYPSMTEEQRALRSRLRAHGRQLGDTRDTQRGTQTLDRLMQACAYEHWHRMLFARFLAENELLLEPESQVAISLDDCRELARDQGRDWLELAAEYAQKMLLEVFRADDPVLEVALPPETQQQLEAKLEGLEAAVFTADDSLGWVYQFWQKEEKERVNASEVKIGAKELAPVTQLFTEDYMVLFLLENTLGAWWTAKRRAEGKDPALPGYEWTYLRLNEDGTPAAGPYEGWPPTARELRVLDPCMGSGHFLTFALPILARMRVEEEGLSLEEAIAMALRDNLYGLELDARCSQIAAFNLALTAWRLDSRNFTLPAMKLACSGLSINAKEEDWVQLARDDAELQGTMRELYFLFRQAPTLGSLIDPTRSAQPLLIAKFERVRPLLEQALAAEATREEERELAIAAQGVLSAAQILTDRFALVVTNVPYLGRGKQSDSIKDYCHEAHRDSKADLSTAFIDRCLTSCANGGTAALVTPQNWLFLPTYNRMRVRLLRKKQIDVVVRLGANAFQDMNFWAATTALAILTNSSPAPEHDVLGIDASGSKERKYKQAVLRTSDEETSSHFHQAGQLRNADGRITMEEPSRHQLLSVFAFSPQGTKTGDDLRLKRNYWELGAPANAHWRFLHGAPLATGITDGMSYLLDYSQGESAFARPQGQSVWGKHGAVIKLMGGIAAARYFGDVFDSNVTALVPRDEAHLPAIWSFVESDEFELALKAIEQSVKVNNATVGKVPFDLAHWQRIASKNYPKGLPSPQSEDPTQWVFDGQPRSARWPLLVSTARLLGYRWPRQTGSNFPDCPALSSDGLEGHADPDGVVCLSSLGGEPAAEQRLRNLLADAFTAEWSAKKLSDLLGDAPSLKVWLRDHFFEEHCNLFHQRPFVWHISDGRKDGFHALVNYHKLAGPNGEGRRTLEKLIYTSLGDWITRQRAEVASGADGAEARLLAAEHLQHELIKILEGEPPYDLFIRWKPLHDQPIGWEPDINGGVRLNIRPWLQAKPYKGGKNACILRWTPKSIKHGKDRGKEPEGEKEKEDYPWFWSWDQKTEDFYGGDKFDGNRWNDLHYTHEFKQKARERHAAKGVKA